MIKVVTEKLICKIFCFMSIIVWGILFLYSMFETWINDWDLVSEYVKPVQDSLIGNAVGIMAVLAVVMILYTWGSRWIDRINVDILAVIVCIFALVFSIYWVGATNTYPQADSLIVYDLAKAFENLDFSSLQQGGYVSIYRHQLGLITFWRLLFKIFGMGNYLVFQYLNAMMIPVLIFSGYRITKRLSENNKIVELLYLLLTITCVPLYCYVPFLYGEMISTTLVVFAAWMLMDTFEKFSPVKIVLMSISLGAAIQFRRNTVIFLIAFLIVTVIQLCRGWDWKVIITIVGIVAGAILLQFYINNIYHELIPENSLEAPASAYIAMGVNTDNGMAGWHNFYDQNVFVNNDCNIEKTNQEAWTYFGDFFRENKDNPRYLADFYYRKICSQWNSPMYQCLAMNNIFAGEQSAFAADVYFGKLRGILETEMNIHQLLIYGGVLCALLFAVKGWWRIDNYVLLIGVFGGFLFSILWEAKTRYVFPYYLVMLPYGGLGIYQLVKWLHQKYIKSIKTNHKKEEDIRKEVAA